MYNKKKKRLINYPFLELKIKKARKQNFIYNHKKYCTPGSLNKWTKLEDNKVYS